MLVHVIAIAALGATCGAWILFQRWIARVDRNAPGIRRRCGACEGTCGET
jgi:hypothetical protein